MLVDLLLFTATANLSIVSLNLSLMINRVGFYQVIHLFHACLRPFTHFSGPLQPLLSSDLQTFAAYHPRIACVFGYARLDCPARHFMSFVRLLHYTV